MENVAATNDEKEVMQLSLFALRGHILYSRTKELLLVQENGYAICENGTAKGVFAEIPEKYKGIKVIDYHNCLIIPGLVDLHLHAPQFPFRTLAMDLELLEWLNANTFPEEAKYRDLEYAGQAYRQFGMSLKQSATTRAVMFATIHIPATKLLMDILEEVGVQCYVGKVNMDRNAPEYLCEADAEQSVKDTREWLSWCKGNYQNVFPILTPRFIPSCSDELIIALAGLQKETKLPAQSHLSENESEIAWVRKLSPHADFYGDAYDRLGLFGSNGTVIMAHCVHSSKEEIERMKERGVYIAHCPVSNTNLLSGIAPAKLYLKEGLKIGLGTDMAGGHDLSLFHVMAHAIQVSKLRFKLLDQEKEPLAVEEVFYMATKGGGAFFGKVGSFEAGYEFDAVVLDDSHLLSVRNLNVKERLERIIYLSEEQSILAKYVAGRCIRQGTGAR